MSFVEAVKAWIDPGLFSAMTSARVSRCVRQVLSSIRCLSHT